MISLKQKETLLGINTLMNIGSFLFSKPPKTKLSDYYYQRNAKDIYARARAVLSHQKTALAAQGVYQSPLFQETKSGVEADLFALQHQEMITRLNLATERYNQWISHVMPANTQVLPN